MRLNASGIQWLEYIATACNLTVNELVESLVKEEIKRARKYFGERSVGIPVSKD